VEEMQSITMKIDGHSIMKVAAIVVLATLVTLLALPTFSSHTCVYGSDDYDQCVSSSSAEEESDSGSEPQTSDVPVWLWEIQSDDGGCDNDDDTPAPPCS
jgi:hypothetical protein